MIRQRPTTSEPMINITANSNNYSCDREPDTCPICHKHVHAAMKLAHTVGQLGRLTCEGALEALYLCPSTSCGSYFIAYYRETSGANGGRSSHFRLTGTGPRTMMRPTIFDGIKSMSPDFDEIYAQATEAGSRQLDQVAGIGFRKALEFLVKDYCISQHPNDAEKIKATPLASCIEKYVSDQNIKDCAKLATWLGNDETHYVRKWNDKDVEDLKSLIGLTSSWIETSIKTARYRASMLPPT